MAAKSFDIKAASLSGKLQKQYDEYRKAQQEANALGAALAKAVKADWDTRYPEGLTVDGEVRFCTFTANFGKLKAEYVGRRRGPRTDFDANAGVDVFPQ